MAFPTTTFARKVEILWCLADYTRHVSAVLATTDRAYQYRSWTCPSIGSTLARAGASPRTSLCPSLSVVFGGRGCLPLRTLARSKSRLCAGSGRRRPQRH